LLAEGLEVLAWMAAAGGQARRAARLGGAAQALRDALCVPLLPAARADHDRAVRTMREALGEETFVVAWDAGRGMPLDETVALTWEDDIGVGAASRADQALPRLP
jgi:hypothetical protein